ncbi:MAG: GNAT family N-acetyltransferase [Rhodospirillaceae bacterium]|nr:GNAT family N-acetyltransferase [Rhodospirillales bacterium]
MILRHWREADLVPFRALGVNPGVMEFFPATLSAAESDALAHQLMAAFAKSGWGMWAVELPGQAPFIGTVGLKVPAVPLPCSPCVEVAWRLDRDHWGKGLATEAAQAVLDYGFSQLGLAEIVSFTALPNVRSKAVMERLGMQPDGEFDHPALPEGHWLRRHALYRKKAP